MSLYSSVIIARNINFLRRSSSQETFPIIKEMDESWRMRMGMPSRTTVKPNLPRRKSTEDTSHRGRPISGESSDAPLEPEDFSDVFGGPPRTILSRQFDSAGFLSSQSTSSFYGEILRQNVEHVLGMSGRNLPEFRIPVRQQRRDHNQNHHNAFYSDIFSWEDGSVVKSRARSKSKTSSSSALSSEELSPLRPDTTGDGMDDASFFYSKLRPINVGSRWTSIGMGRDDHRRQHITPPFSDTRHVFNTNNNKYADDNTRNHPFEFSRRNSSLETISLEPVCDGSMRVSIDDLELKSPSSVVSSICQLDQHNITCEIEEEKLQQNDIEIEEDEIMTSYVIEINTDNREDKFEAIAVNEAIAWENEKFRTRCIENEWSTKEHKKETSKQNWASARGLEDDLHEQDFTQQLASKFELQILDEKIRLWATGKESDIRLLLSTLHHILWPNSGWFAIPLMNLVESSQVKKAYKKAQLCLHPDKLQQRGARIYIAEKTFSLLQGAWATFTSQCLC